MLHNVYLSPSFISTNQNSGSLYQAFSLVLHLAFLAGGSSANACLYHNSFVAVSFIFLGVWAALQGCLLDVVVWAAVVCASNVGQVLWRHSVRTNWNFSFKFSQRTLELNFRSFYNYVLNFFLLKFFKLV